MNTSSLVKIFAVIGILVFGGWALFALMPEKATEEETLIQEVTEEVVNDELVYDKNEPVYVTLYSHNEDTWDVKVSTEDKYLDYRGRLIARAELLAEYDIEWDWQSDLPVVDAVAKYDVEGAQFLDHTDGENLLVYIESLGASLDPHVHTNSMADVAYVMEELGGSPTGVIGGALYAECGDEHLDFLDLVSWKDASQIDADGYIAGEVYPDYKWQPTIFSGPAFGGHWFDEWSSGIWKPGDASEFYEHDVNSTIAYVGQGDPHDGALIGEEHASGSGVHHDNGDYIKELVDKISSGELPTGTVSGDRYIYTASLHFRDTNIVRDGDTVTNTLVGLESILDELEPLREAGLIEFINYEDVVALWEEEYNSVPNHIGLDSFEVYDDVLEQAMGNCEEVSKRPPL
jgi:hypothetical protein